MPCEHNVIEEEVLRRIVPGKEDRDRLEKIARKAEELIRAFLDSKGVMDAYVAIEGSYAKDTWLKGDVDLDLFILLPKDTCIETIESGLIDDLEEWLERKGYMTQRRYAQHPYLRALINNTWVEIVPGCRVEDPANPLTPVDRTPFHRKYIVEHTTEEQRNEIRLLKSFLKGIGIYGAEIAVQGFSGYLAELLIVKYRCFRTLLKEASSKWRPRLFIEIEPVKNHYKRKILEAYRDAPLVVIDPVDPNRNVAAAVSYKSFSTFILAAQLYLKRPSKTFFHIYLEKPRPKNSGDIIALAGSRVENIVVVSLLAPGPEPPDNFWGIARRIARLLTRILHNYSFRVLDHGVHVTSDGVKAIIALELESRRLPSYELRYGPPTWNRGHAENFLRKHLGGQDSIGPWIDDSGRLVVIKRRKYVDAIDAIISTMTQWLPKSARKYSITVDTLLGAAIHLDEEGLQWLREFIVKRPHWI